MKSSGAVSPAARATASITPVMTPGSAVGSVTLRITWVRVQPMPYAASFMIFGTIFKDSSAVRMTVGTMSTASAAPPAGAE